MIASRLTVLCCFASPPDAEQFSPVSFVSLILISCCRRQGAGVARGARGTGLPGPLSPLTPALPGPLLVLVLVLGDQRCQGPFLP